MIVTNSRGGVETITEIPIGGRVINITGRRFGKLTVLRLLGRNRNGKVKWMAKCDCGNEVPVEGFYLRNGHTVSCGCKQAEKNHELRYIHGMSQTNEHSIYRKMIDRCHRPTETSYPFYGAKGITVCDRWRFGEDGLNGFQCFYQDIGKRPSLMHTLDRIKNLQGYRPGNVRWATRKEQARNTSRTRKFMWDGKMTALSDICDQEGVSRSTVYARIRMGWSIVDAVRKTVKKYKKYGI